MGWKLYPLTETHFKWKEWDRLNALYYDSHPYFDSRFIKPCITHFGKNAHYLAELKDNHDIAIGMLLLTQKKPGLWSLFVPSQLQVAPVFLPCENISLLLNNLLHTLPGYCWMFEILYQDPLNTPINDKFALYHTKLNHCTTTNVDLTSNFDTFWKNRPKKFKQNIRTAFNRLKKDNTQFHFSVKTSSEEIIKGIKSYGLLESKTWKGKNGTAIHPENIQGKFYLELLHDFSKSGNAAIYELYIENELAGSILSISNNHILILLKTTFNEAYKAYSPGRLVQYKFLEHAFHCKRFKMMEAYTNANKDQLDWSTATRNIFHIEIYSNQLIKKIMDLKRGNIS